MKIQSKDVIQADTPERVFSTIDAIANGSKTDRDIALAIGGLDPRQGRYYRRAAEVLGFIKREAGNLSILTKLGEKYKESGEKEKHGLVALAFLSNPLVTRLLPYLEAYPAGKSRKELEDFLSSVASLGTPSMIHRRVSSYIGWLQYFNLAEINRSKIALKRFPPSIPLVTIDSDEEPIFPNHYELREYEEQARRVRNSEEEISFFVSQASRERALASHSNLIAMMAEKIRQYGAIPKSNRYIDLSARVAGFDFIFEMKSTTIDNIQDQVRRGLSQLYEYRYIQNIQNSRLVLVIENPFPKRSHWLIDYLMEDRNILVVWDASGRFHCPTQIADQLPFL